MVLTSRAVLARAVLALAALSSACHPRSPAAPLPELRLVDTAGGTHAFPAELAEARFTVLVFYAEHCPCFRSHEGRLRDLATRASSRGVRVVLVDSERSGSLARDRAAVEARGLPPIVLDPGARLADAVGAEYATYSVVYDAAGALRYRGGIDDDKNELRAGATPLLANALEDLLAGRPVARPEGKVLGCALETR